MQKRSSGADSDGDSETSSDEESDSEGGGGGGGREPARLHHRSVAAGAAINRVACMPQQPGIVATWGADSNVCVHNVSKVLSELADEPQPRPKAKNDLVHVRISRLGCQLSELLHACHNSMAHFCLEQRSGGA